jgi:hypothetical protein
MPGVDPGSWQQDYPVGMVPWPAQLAADQQGARKPRGQSAGDKAAGEADKGPWRGLAPAFA